LNWIGNGNLRLKLNFFFQGAWKTRVGSYPVSLSSFILPLSLPSISLSVFCFEAGGGGARVLLVGNFCSAKLT